jgi:hypothetical protein
MKAMICLMFACVLTASTTWAQAPAAPAAQGGQKVPLSEGLRRSYNGIKMNLTEAAQKLDEASYSYTPSPEIRGFGAQLAHVANSQFNSCSAATGVANPHRWHVGDRGLPREAEAEIEVLEVQKILG